MTVTIFYLWQADLPNNTDRGFIRKALERAAHEVRAEATAEIEPVIEPDTKGVAGAPNISDTIFRKIDVCDIFAWDVSIINAGSRKHRKTPNPNVLVELSYALKKLGWQRIILIQNTHFGKRCTGYLSQVVCSCWPTSEKARIGWIGLSVFL